MLKVYQLANNSNSRVFHAACKGIGLKLIYHPFWELLPLSDIYVSITPDILHQMHQEVLKHLISWLTHPNAFGAAEVDARCHSLPPNHHITQFPRGITTLQYLGFQAKSIKICAKFSLVLLSICCFLVDEYHHM